MENKRKHVVQIGSSGFPFGMAAIEKIRLISLGLIHAGMDVTVINRKGTYKPDSGIDIPVTGTYEGIDYVFCSGSIYRPSSFLKRNWKKIVGKWNEFWLLVKYKRERRLDYAIIQTREFPTVMYYKLLSVLLGFKVVFSFVELGSVLPERNKPVKRLLDKSMEGIGLKLMDGTLPISEVLCDFMKTHAPNTPYFKLPIVCEFAKFEHLEKQPGRDKFFLYCGSLMYLEVIAFIVEAFHTLQAPSDWYLYMVVNGPKENLQRLQAKIKDLQLDSQVKIFSWIPYEELIQKYKDATALLIPLRNTLQDKARFPHKIGEYLASGNPVITTQIGEVKHYFEHERTALMAPDYDLEAFVTQMRFVLEHPEAARTIGLNGKTYGLNNFDCHAYGRKLKHFLLSLNEESVPAQAVIHDA